MPQTMPQIPAQHTVEMYSLDEIIENEQALDEVSEDEQTFVSYALSRGPEERTVNGFYDGRPRDLVNLMRGED